MESAKKEEKAKEWGTGVEGRTVFRDIVTVNGDVNALRSEGDCSRNAGYHANEPE